VFCHTLNYWLPIALTEPNRDREGAEVQRLVAHGSNRGEYYRRRGAFSYIEATVALVILGMGIATGMNLYGSYARGSLIETERAVAHALCTDLMEEILSKRFESGYYGSGSFGRADWENVRADFDDVDDYDGWTEDPPLEASGDPLASGVYTGYKRQVLVWNVDEDDLQTPGSDGDTAAKVVEVTVFKDRKVRAQLIGHRTRYALDRDSDTVEVVAGK